MTSPSNAEHNRHPLQDVRAAYSFKNPNFHHSAIVESGKVSRYAFKNLKQITTQEKQQTWSPETVLYSDLDAGPSVRPPLKLSDLSACPAQYVDPKSHLRYSSLEEYTRLHNLPPDIVAGLLQLRGANATHP